jgi:hypothetical protein
MRIFPSLAAVFIAIALAGAAGCAPPPPAGASP